MHLFGSTSSLMWYPTLWNIQYEMGEVKGRASFAEKVWEERQKKKGEGKKRQNGHMACQTSPLLLELVPAPDTNKYVGVSWEVI